MTGEERWLRAFEDERRTPTEWQPDMAALRKRVGNVERRWLWWALELAVVLQGEESDGRA